MTSEHEHPDLLDEELEADSRPRMMRLSASCNAADSDPPPHCSACRRPFVAHRGGSGALWWYCYRCGHLERAD